MDHSATAPAARPTRLWPAAALVGAYWLLYFVVGSLDKPYFFGFLYAMASAGLFVLAYCYAPHF